MKFKIGQKVKVVDSTYNDYSFKQSMIGKTFEVERLSCAGKYYVFNRDGSQQEWFNELDLEAVPEEKTWDTLQVNDVLVNGCSDEITVLGICGRVIFWSRYNNKDVTHSFDTKETLIKWGWKIKQNTPTEEVVEMTVEEATKKLGELLGKTVKVVK